MQNEIGIYRMPLFVSFIYEADQSTKQIAREILLKVTNADVDFIKPTTPFERPKPLSSRQVRHNNVEAGLPLEKDTKHTFKAKWALGHYPIKDQLRKAFKGVRNEIPLDAVNSYKAILGSALEQGNYFKRFSLLLHCEELQMELDIRNYDMEVINFALKIYNFANYLMTIN